MIKYWKALVKQLVSRKSIITAQRTISPQMVRQPLFKYPQREATEDTHSVLVYESFNWKVLFPGHASFHMPFFPSIQSFRFIKETCIFRSTSFFVKGIDDHIYMNGYERTELIRLKKHRSENIERDAHVGGCVGVDFEQRRKKCMAKLHAGQDWAQESY